MCKKVTSPYLLISLIGGGGQTQFGRRHILGIEAGFVKLDTCMENRLIEESSALIREGYRWLNEFQSGEEARHTASRASGADLARRMRSKTFDFGCNKATELHDDIQTLIMLAAKVAVLTYGTKSPEIAVYERDVYHYRAFPTCRSYVNEHDTFKQSCA